MFTARIENGAGDVLTLTGQEQSYQVIGIRGLNPPPAQINTTAVVGLDGARFNSARLQVRNIVIQVRINGDVEANRRRLYRYFRTKEPCVFYFANDSVDTRIAGYVESVECDLFSRGEVAQISILCPYPYFRSVGEVTAYSDETLGVFTFPFSINADEPVIFSSIGAGDAAMEIYNSSETATGFLLTVGFAASASSIAIKDTATGDEIDLAYAFAADDQVTVSTYKGQKSITLIRGGVASNLFAALVPGSVLFELAVGVNRIEYLVDGMPDDTAVLLTFRFYNLYRGV